MQDQPIGVPAPSTERVQQLVLQLLQERGGPPLWSMRELAMELGDELDTVDAVDSLEAAGLVHRCHEFVFASRAAVRLAALSRL